MPGVLFVDDDPIFRAVVRRVLEQAGIPLTSVEDPAHALLKAREVRPDLVILDYMMPGLDGLQLFQSLQSDESLRSVPVWMCSSRNDDEFISRTFEAGIADYITKPIAVKTFEGKIRSFLRRVAPRANTEVRSLRRDMGEAGSTIRKMMHEPPSVEGLDVGIVYEPLEEIGGDFYDVFETRRGTRMFVVGDVSGHGVSAAVIQTMARKLIQICVRSSRSTEAAMVVANAELKQEIPGGSFVAAIAAEWDPRTQKFSIYRFGVPHPILRTREPGPEGPARVVLSGGTVMGKLTGDAFLKVLSPIEVQLSPGEVLLLHTDGAVEAVLPDGSDFGFSGLRAALAGAPATGAGAIARACAEKVHAAAGPRLDDDLTLIALQARPAVPAAVPPA